VVQNSGGYSTGFTISQSVTIDAAGFNASVISTSGTDLCTISAGAADRVVLRGISFHGANVGNNAINVTQVGDLYVEHCSISEFATNGVNMTNGGNLFVTGTEVRKCSDGIFVGTSGSTGGNLVAHDSRFTECVDSGVFLQGGGSGAATGLLTNCTAALCGFGFKAQGGAARVDLTLTRCRAIGNSGIGIEAQTFSSASATIRIVNCVVTGNGTGIFTSSSAGNAAVLGTSPGTNLIAGNMSGNALGASVTQQ
jgi:hypothetical protein